MNVPAGKIGAAPELADDLADAAELATDALDDRLRASKYPIRPLLAAVLTAPESRLGLAPR